MDPVCKVLKVLFETVLGLGTKNENSSWLLTFSEGLFESTPTSTKKKEDGSQSKGWCTIHVAAMLVRSTYF